MVFCTLEVCCSEQIATALHWLCFVEVASWLKNLRLHKYGSLFAQLSYEEMLGLNEEYLDSKVLYCSIENIAENIHTHNTIAEYIHTFPMYGHWKFQGGGGLKGQNF